jgi:hypothetical protein
VNSMPDHNHDNSDPMPNHNHDNSPTVTAILAEFNAIKEEIRARSSDQSTIISLNVTLVGVIGGFYFSDRADPRILFLIPIVSSLLGMRYIDHVINIDNLGRFIQRKVKPQLNTVLSEEIVDYEVFAESFGRQTFVRYLLFGLPIALLFAGVPLAALALPFFVINAKKYDATFVGGAGLATVLLLVFACFWFDVVRRSQQAQPGADRESIDP